MTHESILGVVTILIAAQLPISTIGGQELSREITQTATKSMEI